MIITPSLVVCLAILHPIVATAGYIYNWDIVLFLTALPWAVLLTLGSEMKTLITFAIVLSFLSLHGALGAQVTDKIASKQVEVVGKLRNGQLRGTLPKSRAAKLKKITLIEKRPFTSCETECRIANLSSPGIVLARSTDFIDTSVHTANGKSTVRYVSHPTFFPTILFGDSLFIFASKDIRVNAEIFNRFVHASALRIKDEVEARELARFFLAATSDYFDRGDKLVISSLEDVPADVRHPEQKSEVNSCGDVKPPAARKIDGVYEVVLYTWEADIGDVTKWVFKMQLDGEIYAHKENVGTICP